MKIGEYKTSEIVVHSSDIFKCPSVSTVTNPAESILIPHFPQNTKY